MKIPGGCYWIGKGTDPDKNLQHEVELQTYYLGRYPVTVAQYQAFITAQKPSHAPDLTIASRSNHPVVNVTWHEALLYCDWLNEQLRNGPKTPKDIRTLLQSTARDDDWQITLPSEAEWEKAARGINEDLPYPWGTNANPEIANYKSSGLGTTCAVGAFEKGVSPYGIYDLSGNVWEWTCSDFEQNNNTQKLTPPKVDHDGYDNTQVSKKSRKILKGGRFTLRRMKSNVAPASRNYPPGNLSMSDFGSQFRVSGANDLVCLVFHKLFSKGVIHDGQEGQ